MTATLLIFGAYLVATVAIGIWAAARGKESQEDFFLGGRGVSAFSMALSAVSSGRSAWLIVGASGAAWANGLSSVWVFPGYILAELSMFLWMGPKLRARSVEVDAITVPEALAACARGDRAPSRLPVRQLAGLACILFLTTYVSAQLVAGGKTLEAVVGVEGETVGLCITAGIVLVYTILGGYRAVVLTDVLQALFMLFGLIVLPVLGLLWVGGFAELAEALRAIDPALLEWSGGWIAFIGGWAIGLGSFGNPHILVRHMSLRDPREARAAAITGTVWNVLMAAGALVMGLVGRAIYPTDAAFPGGDREFLYATLSQDVTAHFLFASFVGVLLATLFAAIMSTCDSQLLVIASSLLRDLRPRTSISHGLLSSRVTVLLALLAAVALSFGQSPIVFHFVLLSWAALGAAFGPPLLFALYDPRTTTRGVFFGILTGAIVAALWAVIPALDALVYELVPAFAASALVVFLLRSR